jgi:hypothetical protein
MHTLKESGSTTEQPVLYVDAHLIHQTHKLISLSNYTNTPTRPSNSSGSMGVHIRTRRCIDDVMSHNLDHAFLFSYSPKIDIKGNLSRIFYDEWAES